MKHMYTVAVLSALFVSLASQTVPTAAAAPAVVDRLSLDRYLGTWYEIASVKPPFQQGCACVTANYALREDGSVQVTNSCRRGGPEGEEVSIRGSALPTDDPAKFSVFFYGPVPSEPNYWVVLLDPDYRFAVVSGGADFTPFWILSRTRDRVSLGVASWSQISSNPAFSSSPYSFQTPMGGGVWA